MTQTKKNKQEFSFTEGSVFGSLIRFALPVLGALVLQAAYGAVDLLVVGQFGDASGISAVGSGSSFMQMVTFVITSLAMGSTVIIGQHIGEKRPQAAGDAVGTTIVLFSIIGVILTILLEIFAGNIDKVFVSYKARLTRFGFDYFNNIFSEFGVEIIVLDELEETNPDFQTELTNDLISIIHHFSIKLYSNKRKKLKEIEKLIESTDK